MDKLLDKLQSTLGEQLPGVAGALLILFIGWVVALIVKAVLKKALNLCKINDRINGDGGGSKMDVESGVATGGYYVVLLTALVAVFNQLGLDLASEPIQGLLTQVFDFIPKLIGGAVLGLVAWLCARIAKQVTTGLVSTVDAKVQAGKTPLSVSLGQAAFWLVLLIFLPGILGTFELEGLLAPVQSMVAEITGILPNIFGAAVIILVGWFVARILRDLVTNLLAATGIDKASPSSSASLSSILGTVVHFLIFIPALIAGLKALKMSVIADPATEMLGSVMAAVPNVFAALAIVAITYFVAKPVTGLITKILAGMGLDSWPGKMGFGEKLKDGAAPSVLIGKAIFFFMMLFATVEASNRLGFAQVSEIVSMFITFGGQVLLGGAIIAIGLWIANLVQIAMNKAAPSGNNPLSILVKFVIIGLVFAMGLRAMGLANEIVNMAFGITLGATAVAFALAFGIGGRDAAGDLAKFWVEKIKK